MDIFEALEQKHHQLASNRHKLEQQMAHAWHQVAYLQDFLQQLEGHFAEEQNHSTELQKHLQFAIIQQRHSQSSHDVAVQTDQAATHSSPPSVVPEASGHHHHSGHVETPPPLLPPGRDGSPVSLAPHIGACSTDPEALYRAWWTLMDMAPMPPFIVPGWPPMAPWHEAAGSASHRPQLQSSPWAKSPTPSPQPEDKD